jgi:hypothetical protein
MYVYF